MITARLYTLEGRFIADLFLGNKLDSPIAITSFDTAVVDYKDDKFCIIATKNEEKSILIADRLYLQKTEAFVGKMEFADMCATPKVRERIRILDIKMEDDARWSRSTSTGSQSQRVPRGDSSTGAGCG